MKKIVGTETFTIHKLYNGLSWNVTWKVEDTKTGTIVDQAHERYENEAAADVNYKLMCKAMGINA